MFCEKVFTKVLQKLPLCFAVIQRTNQYGSGVLCFQVFSNPIQVLVIVHITFCVTAVKSCKVSVILA